MDLIVYLYSGAAFTARITRVFLLLFLLLLTARCGYSQIYDTTFLAKAHVRYKLSKFQVPTYLAVRSYSGVFTPLVLISVSDTMLLTSDPHSNSTAMVKLPTSETDLYIVSPDDQTLSLFYITVATNVPRKARNARIAGTEIDVVPPDEWRQGLPAPEGFPQNTIVDHLVIHHSNIESDDATGLEQIRSIYVLHTEVNGWNDIGYNYLIAPDGTIFQGRDDKELFDADNVLGSHLCGVNSGVMGICVMGTFQDRLPTGAAIASLIKLLAWKIKKDHLNVTAMSFRWLGPPSDNPEQKQLPVIFGHRDGCSQGYTTCPGETLYKFIGEIRAQVAAQVSDTNASIYPNPVVDILKTDFHWSVATVYDSSGNQVGVASNTGDGEISTSGLQKGLYIFIFQNESGVFNFRLIRN